MKITRIKESAHFAPYSTEWEDRFAAHICERLEEIGPGRILCILRQPYGKETLFHETLGADLVYVIEARHWAYRDVDTWIIDEHDIYISVCIRIFSSMLEKYLKNHYPNEKISAVNTSAACSFAKNARTFSPVHIVDMI